MLGTVKSRFNESPQLALSKLNLRLAVKSGLFDVENHSFPLSPLNRDFGVFMRLCAQCKLALKICTDSQISCSVIFYRRFEARIAVKAF